MPNGVDKNFRRLVMACALYRQRYGEWPSQVRLDARLLHNLASLFDDDNFARLAAHLELRTPDKTGISVGGRGVVEYGDADLGQLDGEIVKLTEHWFGVELRPDLEHC